VIDTAPDVAIAPVRSVALAFSEYAPGVTFIHVVMNGGWVNVAIGVVAVPDRISTNVIGTVPPEASTLTGTLVDGIEALFAGIVIATVGTRSRPSCITCATNAYPASVG